jgi:aldose 1-epimerase
MSFSIYRRMFGSFETVILEDSTSGIQAEIALRGATLLNYSIMLENRLFNIIDGFKDEEELKAARGARSWIMIPFANRIPDGKYNFEGNEYQIKPIPPRTQVIHGFASYLDYKIHSAELGRDSAEVILKLDNIRPGVFEGYPFSLDIFIKFLLTKEKLLIEITAENSGERVLPFGTGWHPYFRTNDKGIENLVLTIDAEQVIRLDSSYIPVPGDQAYVSIKEYPEMNFNSDISLSERQINGRKLDDCYAVLKKDENGLSQCSLYDPENGLKIEMFQRGGVTLAFSGDSLSSRVRKSVALEPMQFLTNAFNREEFQEDIKINPGEKSVFTFGVRAYQV